MLVVLLCASLSSLRLLKFSCLLILLGNALALYFMDTYGVVLDRDMMGNVFNTNAREAMETLHPRLLLYMAVFLVLPGILIVELNIQKISLLKHALGIAATLFFATTWLYANASNWLWIDKHAKQLGALMLPWSYVVNTVRHFDQQAAKNRQQILLPPAQFHPPAPMNNKRIVVLVIGEAARAKNFSHYGYGRNTNAYTQSGLLAVMQNTRSCATYTTQSLACMLSHQGASVSTQHNYETLPSYLHRHGVSVIWRSNNWGEPSMKTTLYEKLEDIQKNCPPQECANHGFDEILLHGLVQKISASDNTRFLIVLHQTGSHGPAYHTKYPPEFERFKPVCRSVQLSDCSNESIVNAYDNTIVYTDYILSRLITLLQELKNSSSVMMYVSDHGESLGEYGLYLHGTPNSIAPDVQRDIPFLVWMSKNFQQERGLGNNTVQRGTAHSHDHIFHSVMGALGVRSAIYKADLDVFHP